MHLGDIVSGVDWDRDGNRNVSGGNAFASACTD